MALSTSMQEAISYLSSWLPFYRKHQQIPGVQFAITLSSDVVWAGASGSSDVTGTTPLREDHLFHVASHSKMFTAVAIMQLREQGKLLLDDPLGKWLPWLDAVNTKAIASVSIREVLSHGSGMLRDGADARYWGLEKPFPSSDELLNLLGEHPATYAASEKFKYSNVAYALLGEVIEAVSGMSFAESLKREIVERLEIINTGADFDESRIEEFAQCHTAFRPGMRQVQIEHVATNAMASATGVYSTARDLCQFVSALCFGNVTLLSDESKRLMQQAQWEVPGAGYHYGLGLAIRTVGDRRIIGHSGNWTGHNTATYVDPRTSVAVAIATNAIEGRAIDMALAVFRVLNFAEQHKLSERAADLDKFCGRFETIWGVFDIVRFGDSLYGCDPTSSDPTDRATELEVVDHCTLRVAKSYGTSGHGELVTYEFEDDRARCLHWGEIIWPSEVFRERINQAEVLSVKAI